MVENNLRSAFSLFEQGSGTIVIAQVVSIMAKTLRDMIPKAEVWREIVEGADTNKDGQINFEEFK